MIRSKSFTAQDLKILSAQLDEFFLKEKIKKEHIILVTIYPESHRVTGMLIYEVQNG